MITWKIQTIPLKNLKDNPKNPREITKKQLKHLEDLIKDFGLIDKPIVNLDMTIIGGHQRIRILKKKKIKEVDCWIPDIQLEPAQIDRLCVGLNLNQGHWDWDCLANEFEPLDLLNWGFTEEQLIGSCKEAEDLLSDSPDENSNKKKKACPNCGHEL